MSDTRRQLNAGRASNGITTCVLCGFKALNRKLFAITKDGAACKNQSSCAMRRS